jgi:hypothetical protein
MPSRAQTACPHINSIRHRVPKILFAANYSHKLLGAPPIRVREHASRQRDVAQEEIIAETTAFVVATRVGD